MKKRAPGKKRNRIAAILLGMAGGIAAICCIGYGSLFGQTYGDGFDNSVYETDAYAGSRAMIIVPHEDDDLNMAGGLIRLFVDGGAEVYVLFTTNGDQETAAETRFAEAIQGLSVLGVPQERILFLGYGDNWAVEPPYYHLYHADDDATMRSMAGYTQTYGTHAHPDFATQFRGAPSAYTRGNYRRDLGDAILWYRPDHLFVVDLDSHSDHVSTSLLFDKTMGELLRAHPDYRPRVYKGYAYSTAWFAPDDYYAQNVCSTLPPSPDVLNDVRFALDTPNFRWSERVRYPMPRETLGYTKRASLLYAALKAHASQDAVARMGSIVSGDSVFFERQTTGLLYGADVAATSGDPACLIDFQLVDTCNLYDWPMKFDAGIWTPDASDAQPAVTFTFPAPVTIGSVAFYDAVEPADNVLGGVLTFSDGSTVDVPAPDPTGAKSCVTFAPKHDIVSMTFTVTAREGAHAGLTEIEAYAPSSPSDPTRIKLTLNDENETFLYRYVTNAHEIPLSVYRDSASDAPVNIRATNGAAFENGVLHLPETAAPGSRYRVRAELSDNPAVFDEIEVVTSGGWERLRHRALTTLEALLDRTEAWLKYRLHTAA